LVSIEARDKDNKWIASWPLGRVN